MAQMALEDTKKKPGLDDYAAHVLYFSRELLDAGYHPPELQGMEKKPSKKFCVTSLAYERAKDSLIDVIHMVRLQEWQNIPFFLSHDALMAVKKRLVKQNRLSERARQLLIAANHQVFICNVEDLLDKGGNNNFIAALSPKGYSGDRIDIITRLAHVIDIYRLSLQHLGAELPIMPRKHDAESFIAKVKQERITGTIKEGLRQANWAREQATAIFEFSDIMKTHGHSIDNEVAYLILDQGRVWIQSRSIKSLMPKYYHASQRRSGDRAILAKFYWHEILDRVAIEGQEADLYLRFQLDKSELGMDFVHTDMMAKYATIKIEQSGESKKPANITISMAG